MKLVELSRKAIGYLKDAGEKGINNVELAEKLQIPRRRVYDIIAILKAAGLVDSKREKGETLVLWGCQADDESPSMQSTGTEEIEKLRDQNSKLMEKNEELKEKIKHLRESSTKEELTRTSEKKLFEASGIIVRAGKSLKINQVINSGIQVVVKVNGKGIIVEPISADEN